MKESVFFESSRLGPLSLRNRSIRAAAFEGMSMHHDVSDDLINYHTEVAKGGIGMTTVAYASVSRNGLSFKHQLWLRDEIIPGLKKLSDSVHNEGALASIQIGHCGNMANKSVTGLKPIAPHGGVNWYGPTFPRKMKQTDIQEVIEDFKNSVRIVAASGFDAIEVHAGHGYLISQFLSPYTNKRKDDYGGSFGNRSRFMREVLTAVREAMPLHMALIVKMNSSDGFREGITKEESLLTAKMIEECGSDAIVVSGGFVSKAPMYVLRGEMPIGVMTFFMKDPFKKFFIRLLGDKLIHPVKFEEGYFMDEARIIRENINIPVVLVGGMNSMSIIEKAMSEGFEFVAFARALIENTNFINDLKSKKTERSECTICNYCVAKMYSDQMSCHLNEKEIEPKLRREINKLENA